MSRYDGPRDLDGAIERERPRIGKRDRSRDRVRDRDRSHRFSPSYKPDRGEEGGDVKSMLYWIPSADIDYDVLCADLPLYIGAGSTVERGNSRVS